MGRILVSLAGLEVAPVALARGRVDVQRDDPLGHRRRDRRVAAGVRADVPDDRRRGLAEQVSDQRVLALGARVVVGGGDAVLGPLRPFRLPGEPLHEAGQAVEQGRLPRGAHRLRCGLRDGLGPVRVAALRAGVQVDVAAEAEREPGPRGEECRREIERDAVEVVAEQPAEPDVPVRHERQRGEEVLAELAVGDPRRPGRGPAQRQRVDEDRPAAIELDVVRARVAELEPGLDGSSLDLEREQGRGLQLAEGPLVGIRDERDRLGPDDGERDRRIGGEREIDRLVRDQEPGLLESVEESGLGERVPLVAGGVVDLPEQDAVAAVDEPERVAPGTWIRPDGGLDHSFESVSAGAEAVAVARSSPRTRCQTRAICVRRTNGAATRAAMTAWIARLPEPGSI